MTLGIQFLFSENINIYLQSLGNSFLDDLFFAITTAGNEPVYIFLASLIYWCLSKKTGIRVMYAVLFSAFTAILAKTLFGMPRPPNYLHKVKVDGFGFPSGHALLSSSFWGYLGLGIKNKRLIFVGTIAILSISLSRIYLGVHYAGDVVGGIIFGLAVALIFFKTESGVVDKLEKLNHISRYFVAVIVPMILVIIAAIQSSLWNGQVVGFVMAGIGVGYLLEEERVRFPDAKNNKQRIKRAIVGTAALGLAYLITSKLFLINSDFIFLKYAARGFTSTFIVPWIFIKIEGSFKNQK